jgi:hypothetical protein
VNAAKGANGLQAMLPRRAGRQVLITITRDSEQVRYETRRVKGVEYAMFNAPSGRYTVRYAADNAPQVITSLSPAAGAENHQEAVAR